MLSPKLRHLQDLHLLVEIQQIETNSMLVVVSQKDTTSTLMVGKLAAPYSLMRLDLEILTVGAAAPALLWASAKKKAKSGLLGLHPRPMVVDWPSILAACTRRIRTSGLTGSP